MVGFLNKIVHCYMILFVRNSSVRDLTIVKPKTYISYVSTHKSSSQACLRHEQWNISHELADVINDY